MFPRSSVRRHASALLIVLVAVAIVTVVLVATFSRVRVSSGIVRSVADSTTAALMVGEAENSAVATLFAHTAPATGSDSSWISRPGEIVLLERSPGSAEVTGVPVPLHSGISQNAVDGVNLNAASLSQSGRSLVSGDSNDALLVRWIYVRKDGSRSTGGAGAYDAGNPLVGRFAYWTDDESTKLNANVAGERDPSAAASDPAQIPLRVLSSSGDATLAGAIRQTREQEGIFQTSRDIRRALESNPGHAVDFDATVFSITNYNHSSQVTFFDEPKIVLTTNPDLADGQPYIDLANLADTVERINRYLTRTDWPVAPGQSYQEKFYAGSAARITQLALNIIEYVRAKETPATEQDMGILTPIRGSVVNGRFVVNATIGNAESFRGTNRGPRTTELAIWRAANVNPDGTRTFRIFKEVHLPEYCGLEAIDLTRLGRYEAIVNVGSPQRVQIRPEDCWPNPILSPGDYRIVSWTQNLPADQWPSGVARIRSALFSPTDSYPSTNALAIDTVPLESLPLGAATTTIPIPVTTGPTGSLTVGIAEGLSQVMQSIEVDDPFLNSRAADWVVNASDHTLGLANAARSVGQSAKTSSPEQDMDQGGNVTDVGVVLPPPPGRPGNLRGRMESIAELGHIHTGVQVAASGQPGTPWRTLRLQPRHPDAPASGSLPDWALLDAFAIPAADLDDPLTSPFPGASGGKINLNSRVEPFSEAIDRLLPLAALFTDLTEAPAEFDPSTISGNISGRRSANTPIASGKFADSSATAAFTHPGEIIEAAGVADRGEASEQLLKQVIDHVVVRGNVFTIYAVGQALIQTPAGDITVRGEERRMIMIERMETRDAGTSTAAVGLRKILSKPMIR